jgi:adenosine deaminase
MDSNSIVRHERWLFGGCPTSNVMLGRVESLAEHPIRKLYEAGVKVTVNTDDVLVFGQSVSDEFLNLYRVGLFDAAELDELRQNGLSEEPLLARPILDHAATDQSGRPG